jgi:hypothetical protein
MTKILTIVIIFLFTTCTDNELITQSQESINLQVLVDVTDTHTLLPAVTPFLQLLGLDKNKNKRVDFNLAFTTDKSLTKDYYLKLRSGVETLNDNTLDDEFHRDRLVLQFYASLRYMLDTVVKCRTQDSTLLYTESFRSIAKALTQMTHAKVKQNFLFVYSDLVENSDLYNAYAHLKNSPSKMTKALIGKFDKMDDLPNNLQNITVYLLYEPQTRSADLLYKIMSKIYIYILQSRGAKVIVQSTNTFNIVNDEY